MLQTRFENEQFNSLPSLHTNHRSRNDYITTDRPDSAQLVDLHIYIIPKSIWKNVQHLAQNEAMDDAISAGFVRVSAEMKLRNLRKSIETLCGMENYFPREFIFLRSVGRCLTRVKQTQEFELKVKNYRPPQTLASEIYLLEGRHEDHANIPSASPALSSASYVFGNRRQHRVNLDDHGQETSRRSHQSYRKPLRTGKKENLPVLNTSHVTYRRPLSRKGSWTKFPQLGLDLDESSPNTSVEANLASRELTKLKEEQERLRRRQVELERMRRAAEEKKLHSERDENERQRRRHEKEELERAEKERQRRQQEKEQVERDEAERRRRQRGQSKAETERRRLEKLQLAATKIQASFRGFQDRREFRERKKKNEKKIDTDDDDELSDGSRIISRTSLGSTSDLDSNPSRPETRTIKKEPRKSLQSNSSLSLHSKSEDLSLKDNQEDTRTATVTKIRHFDEEIFPISTPDIHEDETYQSNRQQQSDEVTRKAKELAAQRRQELAKPRQREDADSLRTHIAELHTDRARLEKRRDEVIKQLKYMHHRITLRRQDARDLWKKKYFQEKKKTPAMESRTAGLKIDLDHLQSKVVKTIESESKHSAEVGCSNEADLGNLIFRVTGIQYEMQNLHHQIDQAKLRLTTDIKLRNQADSECRLLKHELIQAKMNLNHIKTRTTV